MCDVGQIEFGFEQQALGGSDATLAQILVRRKSHRSAEGARERGAAQAGMRSQRVQAQFATQALVLGADETLRLRMIRVAAQFEDFIALRGGDEPAGSSQMPQ